MDWKVFWVTFGTIFLAEMGDKTQLAALSMAAETRLPLTVFLAASAPWVWSPSWGWSWGALSSIGFLRPC
jgi:putative Ca2+/H+ antiporter (TMEM165/GDT1 family)